jgi:site-specific recombinase XerD
VSAQPLRVLEGGAQAGAWAQLWQRDRWRQSELPNGDLSSNHRGDRIVSFGRLAQPWLKEAAKRWARARLLAGTSVNSLSCYLNDLVAFSEWLQGRGDATGPRVITRELLEDYMLFVRSAALKGATRQRRIGTLRMFLDEQRNDALRGLPAGALIHAGEIPRIDYRLPKQLPSDVFTQIIDPQRLALLAEEYQRTIVLVLAFTGLRVSSVITLPRDALQLGPDAQPYLRYLNIKLKREAMLPIPPPLEQQLQLQERWLAHHVPQTSYLLPSPITTAWSRRGVDRHISACSVGRLLTRYIQTADIRSADGRLALGLHPHLFRHHLGASMVNEGVPITVVAKVLDHQSLDMTARYAQIHDDTLRREVARWHERVNIRGERIALQTDGPLGEAAWMKERIARAKQALPNGYCGLPLQRTCPHPNACLSCENFLTDGSFRPVHQRQLNQTRRLLSDARRDGQQRRVQTLEHDQTTLVRILEGLDATDHTDDQPGATATADAHAAPAIVKDAG